MSAPRTWFLRGPSQLHRTQPLLARWWNRIVVLARIARRIDDVENILRQIAGDDEPVALKSDSMSSRLKIAAAAIKTVLDDSEEIALRGMTDNEQRLQNAMIDLQKLAATKSDGEPVDRFSIAYGASAIAATRLVGTARIVMGLDPVVRYGYSGGRVEVRRYPDGVPVPYRYYDMKTAGSSIDCPACEIGGDGVSGPSHTGEEGCAIYLIRQAATRSDSRDR